MRPLLFLSIPFFQAMTLAASGDEVAQEAAAECFCSAASFDGGRALLGPVVESGVIFALMESKSQAARSAAARWGKCGMRRFVLFCCFVLVSICRVFARLQPVPLAKTLAAAGNNNMGRVLQQECVSMCGSHCRPCSVRDVGFRKFWRLCTSEYAVALSQMISFSPLVAPLVCDPPVRRVGVTPVSPTKLMTP